jgi:hypothetical protein
MGHSRATGIQIPVQAEMIAFLRNVLADVQAPALSNHTQSLSFRVLSRCDLLRRLTGLRLGSETSGIVELSVNVFASFLELIHALPQASRQVRQLFCPEEDKNDEENYK